MKHAPSRARAGWLSILLAVGLLPFAGAPAHAGLDLAGFSPDLRLEVNGAPVSVEAGDLVYRIPDGARIVVIRGEAAFVSEGSLVRTDAGDAFSLLTVDGRSQVLVHAGALEVTAAGKGPIMVPAGRFVPVTGPDAGILPGPAPSPQAAPAPPSRPAPAESPRPAPLEPSPQAAPGRPPQEPWDPLRALGDSIDRLAGLKQPELRFVIELHPYYALRQTYDSNIYLVPPDKPDGSRVGGGVLGSWITTNNLGALFKLPIHKRQKLEAGYDVEAKNYSQQPSANNALQQKITLAYERAGRRGVNLKAAGSHLNTEDPAFSELVARQRRFQNQATLRLEHARSRLFVYGLDAAYTQHKYLSPGVAGLLNRYQLAFGGDAGIRVGPKTRLLAAYHRELEHYSAGRGDHSRSHRGEVGLDGELAPRLAGGARLGAQVRTHDRPPASSNRRSRTALVTRVELQWKPTRRDTLGFTANRNFEQSTFDTNQFYVATGVGLNAARAYRKITLSASGSFQTDRYPETSTVAGKTANRRDDVYSAGVRADYHIREWLSTGLGYMRRQRFSLFSGEFNYKTDQTTLELKLAF